MEDSILLKGDRVCILPKLLDRILADLHGAHQGSEKLQAQGQVLVYWPGTDADITDYVKRYPLHTRHKATQPVQLLYKGKDYLLICDLFNNYPFLYKTTTKSASPQSKECKS